MFFSRKNPKLKFSSSHRRQSDRLHTKRCLEKFAFWGCNKIKIYMPQSAARRRRRHTLTPTHMYGAATAKAYNDDTHTTWGGWSPGGRWWTPSGTFMSQNQQHYKFTQPGASGSGSGSGGARPTRSRDSGLGDEAGRCDAYTCQRSGPPGPRMRKRWRRCRHHHHFALCGIGVGVGGSGKGGDEDDDNVTKPSDDSGKSSPPYSENEMRNSIMNMNTSWCFPSSTLIEGIIVSKNREIVKIMRVTVNHRIKFQKNIANKINMKYDIHIKKCVLNRSSYS